MKQEIRSSNAQSAPGLLSQAVLSNGFIFTCGFVHLTADGKLIEGTVKEKLAQVMKNIEETLKAVGAQLNDIVKATIYITDISILPEFNKAYVQYFTEPLPAREAVCVSALPLGASIEISVIATKNNKV